MDNKNNNDNTNQSNDNSNKADQFKDFELKLTIYRKEFNQLSEHEQNILQEMEKIENDPEQKNRYEELFNELDLLMKSREDIQKQIENYAKLIEGLDQDISGKETDKQDADSEKSNRILLSIEKAVELSQKIEDTFDQLNIEGGYDEDDLADFSIADKEENNTNDEISDEERELINKELDWNDSDNSEEPELDETETGHNNEEESEAVTEEKDTLTETDNQIAEDDAEITKPVTEDEVSKSNRDVPEDTSSDDENEVDEERPHTETEEEISQRTAISAVLADLLELQDEIDDVAAEFDEKLDADGLQDEKYSELQHDIEDISESLRSVVRNLSMHDTKDDDTEKIANFRSVSDAELNAELQDLRTEAEELENKNRVLAKEIKEQEELLAKLKRGNEVLNKLEDIESELKYHEEKNTSLIDKIHSREEQLQRLEGKVSAYYDEHKRLDEITLGKKEQHKEMEKLLDALRDEEDKMHEKNDLIKSKIEENQQHLVSIKEEAGFILERLTRIKKEEQTKKKDLESIDEKVKSNEKLKGTLEKNISELMGELNDKISKYDDYQRRNETLQKELDEKEEKINKISDDIAEKSNYIRGMKENILALEHSKNNYQTVLKRLMNAREELEDHLLNVGHSLRNLGQKLDSSANLLQEFNPGKLLVGGESPGSQSESSANETTGYSKTYSESRASEKSRTPFQYKGKIFELSDVGNIITLLESGPAINESDPKLLDIVNEFETKIRQFISLVNSERISVSDDEFATAQLINNYLKNIRESDITPDIQPPTQEKKDRFLPAAMNIISKLDSLFADKQADEIFTSHETTPKTEEKKPGEERSFINNVISPEKEEAPPKSQQTADEDPSITFEVFSEDEEETVDYIEEDEAEETDEPESVQPEQHKSKEEISILYAEDNKYVQMIVNNILQRNGFKNVAIVNDGQQALQAAQEDEYDIFLVDLYMPVKDGFELIRELRKIEQYADTPIIAVSAFPMQSDRDKYLESGATDYITKPINKKEFIDKLSKLLHLA